MELLWPLMLVGVYTLFHNAIGRVWRDITYDITKNLKESEEKHNEVNKKIQRERQLKMQELNELNEKAKKYL